MRRIFLYPVFHRGEILCNLMHLKVEFLHMHNTVISPLNKCIHPVNIQMLFVDIITFHNVEHRISSEMDFPKMYLICRADNAHQAVSNYEFWLIFVPEVCGRALTPSFPSCHAEVQLTLSAGFGAVWIHFEMFPGDLQG